MKSISVIRGISLCALLLVVATTASAFENSPIGWASYDTVANPDATQTPAVAGTTGGAGGTVVTVTNETDLRKWAMAENPDGSHPADVVMTGPYIIQVQGTISLTRRVDIMPNRTVIGIGTDPTIIGELRVRGAGSHPGYNVIIRNLIVRDSTIDDKDCITIQDNAHHVWVDHCDISGASDGGCDITHASDYVTVSWNRFHDQDKTSLVGHSDNAASEDVGHLKVTYHHNYFGGVQRQPRVRFSFLCHVFNNFYAGLGYPTPLDGNNYGIASACDAYVLVEGNYFKDQQHPMLCIAYSGTPNGWLVERYNVFNNCGPIEVNPPVSMPEPSAYYTYTLDPAADIMDIVTSGAGVGRIDAETVPPTPDPMTFATAPYAAGIDSISMVATTATDASGVEYYFHCTTAGGHDSAWQDSTSYTDTGLTPNTTYTYQVKARDKSILKNSTAYSSTASATTDPYDDMTPPTPDPMTWAAVPASVSYNSVTMTATAATDLNGVQYFFTNTTISGHDSGWQDGTTYTDTGLTTGLAYTYKVKARDKSLAANETAWSGEAVVTPTTQIIYQAENAVVYQGGIFTEHTGYTGTGYVDVTNAVGSYIEWTVNVPTAGLYTLSIRFANGSTAARNAEIKANGAVSVASLSFAQTGAWTTWTTQNFDATLSVGLNTIRATSLQSTGGPNYDRLDIVAFPQDTTAPAPSQMTWATPPYATGASTIAMTATTASDTSGVEYFFANLTDPNHNSAWQDSATFVDSGLTNNTQYAYTVIARDKSSNHNENAWSQQANATTLRYDCSAAITGDLNGDCQVDFADFAAVANSWAGGLPLIDLNDDDATNTFDMLLFTADWLKCNRTPDAECWN